MSVTRQHAFLIIKPHAVNPKVEDWLQERLNSSGIAVDEWGGISADAIDRGGLVDLHYGALAQRALTVRPRDLPTPSASALEKFETTFLLSFPEAVAKGEVVNATEFMAWSGEPALVNDAFEFERRWRSGPCVKLFPGTYVARVTATTRSKHVRSKFVVNGFYHAMRNKFADPALAPRGIRWYCVSWPEAERTWAFFRNDVVGATKPSDAVEGSLRGYMYKEWEQLGLAAVPYNGIHASASPVEAAYEMGLWLRTSVEETPFFQQCVSAGVPAALVLEWASGEAEGVFDEAEHKDVSDVIATMRAVAGTVVSCGLGSGTDGEPKGEATAPSATNE